MFVISFELNQLSIKNQVIVLVQFRNQIHFYDISNQFIHSIYMINI